MRSLLAFLLLGCVAAATLHAQSAPKKAAAKTAASSVQHPDIGEATGDCLSCHRDMSPDIVSDWEASKHGTRNVPCITCHGAVGAGFVRRPAAARCVACHAEMVHTLNLPAMKGKGCFSCHSAHRLNPHAALFKNAPAKGASK
jgi:hypothetical protein